MITFTNNSDNLSNDNESSHEEEEINTDNKNSFIKPTVINIDKNLSNKSLLKDTKISIKNAESYCY